MLGLHFYLKRLPNGTQGGGDGAKGDSGADNRGPLCRGDVEKGEVAVVDAQPAHMGSRGNQGAQLAGQPGHEEGPRPAGGAGGAMSTARTTLTQRATEGPVEVVDSQGTAG